ncbi:MAG: pro-sigmaK processing inhibitor BofA family protein [Oscillospiraceae bacterium]|nr:pro-sigmaK processing inhibitor BofA family protein [Oscillospiraceae bacterium]
MEQLGVLPYVLLGVGVLCGLIFFHRALRKLLHFLLRMAASLGILALFSSVGSAIGVTLGVNFLNAFVMALLGAPGFGLLLMVRWAFLQ